MAIGWLGSGQQVPFCCCRCSTFTGAPAVYVLYCLCTASVLPLYCLCTAHPPGAEEHETVDDAQGARQRGTLLAAARRCCSRRCRRGCYSCCHGCRWRSSGGGTDSACSQLLLNDCADEGWDVAVGQAGALQGGGQAGAAGAGLHRLPQSAHPFFHHGGVAGGLGGLLRVGGRRRPAAGRGIRAGGQQAAAAAGGGRGGAACRWLCCRWLCCRWLCPPCRRQATQLLCTPAQVAPLQRTGGTGLERQPFQTGRPAAHRCAAAFYQPIILRCAPESLD